MALKGWQMAMMDDAGLGGIKDRHIEKVAASLRETGKSRIDRATFEKSCFENGIDPGCFTQNDLDRLQRKLSE